MKPFTRLLILAAAAAFLPESIYAQGLVAPPGIQPNQVGVVSDAMLASTNKPAVAVVATTNLTLSGEQTIDGVTTAGSLVLATAQTNAAQNGPWLSGTGPWTRPAWFASGSTTQAPQFSACLVRLGTANQGTTWRLTTAGVTIDATAQTWVVTPFAPLTAEITRATTVENTKVATSRQVLSGTGLSGGGDLTADRTLAVVYGHAVATALQGNDPAVALALSAVQPYLTPQTIYVDSANGSDSGTNIGLRGRVDRPFASVGAAIAAHSTGDTIELRQGTYPTSGQTNIYDVIHFRAASGVTATVVPAPTAYEVPGTRWLIYGNGSSVQGITFDSQVVPTVNDYSGQSVLCFYATDSSRVEDCTFRNMARSAISGLAVTNFAIRRCSFDHNVQCLALGDLGATKVPSNVVFEDITINYPIGGSTQWDVDCPSGLQHYVAGSTTPVAGDATGTQLRAPGLAVGATFTRCRAYNPAGTNGIAFQVFHGWTNVTFTDCYAYNYGYDFTCAIDSRVRFVDCTAGYATFGFEYSDCWDMTCTGCVVDHATFGPNGFAHDNAWVNGTSIDQDQRLYGSNGAYGFTVTDSYFKGSGLICQHFSHALIANCTFEPADDGTLTNQWLGFNAQPGPIDYTNQDPVNGTFLGNPTITDITVRNNKFFGGVVANGSGAICVGPGTVNELTMADNVTDGTTINGGGTYFSYNGTPTTNLHFHGNVSYNPNVIYPNNGGFPNDPPSQGYDSVGGTLPTTPANNEVTGSMQFALHSPVYWDAYFALPNTFIGPSGTNSTYTIQSGDTLEYDVWNDVGNTETRWYVDGTCTDGHALWTDAGNNLVDQLGINLTLPTAPYSTGRWYHRVVNLTGAATKTISQLSFGVGISNYGLSIPGGGSPNCTVYLRRVMITNQAFTGNGTTTMRCYVPLTGATLLPDGRTAPALTYTVTPTYQGTTFAQRSAPTVNNLAVAAVTSPQPSVTNSAATGIGGTAGTSTAQYAVVEYTAAGVSCGVGPTGTTSVSNATLSGTSYNIVYWAATPGATYDVYRLTSPGSPASTGKLNASPISVSYLDDTGLAGDGTTPPTANGTGIATVPTPPVADSSIKVPNTSWVNAAITNALSANNAATSSVSSTGNNNWMGNNVFSDTTYTATSGTVAGTSITPTYNETSSTAANTDLLINRTETAVGSGTQRLIDAQVSGTSKFSVDHSGNVVTAGGINFSGALYGTNGCTFGNTSLVGGATLTGNGTWTNNAAAGINVTAGPITTTNATVGLKSVAPATFSSTLTSSSSPGNATISKPGGAVWFAASATSLVVTNTLVSTTSLIQPFIMTHGTGAVIESCVPAGGSFTIYLSTPPTASCEVGFLVINTQ